VCVCVFVVRYIKESLTDSRGQTVALLNPHRRRRRRRNRSADVVVINGF